MTAGGTSGSSAANPAEHTPEANTAASPEAMPQPVLTPITPPKPDAMAAQPPAESSPASPLPPETQHKSMAPQQAEPNPEAAATPQAQIPTPSGNSDMPASPEPMPALSSAQQQAMQEQQQYIQDLAHLRQQQVEQQQQQQPAMPPTATPGQNQPTTEMAPMQQALPQQPKAMPGEGMPGKMPGQNPQALLPPTPQQTPPNAEQNAPAANAAMTPASSPTGSTDGQKSASPATNGKDASFYKDLNDTLVYGEPGHRWNALEEISKRGEAPPETYTILAQTAAPNSPLLPGNLPDETASRLRQASFWALALLNSSQNAEAAAISPAVDPATGQPQKDPKTGQDLYKILPGIREAIQVLSSKKEDPGVQRAAVQMIQQIGQSHPNDKAFLQSILSKVKTSDPNVRALVRMGIPSDPNEIAPPGGSPSASTPNGSQVEQVQQMQANKAAGGQV